MLIGKLTETKPMTMRYQQALFGLARYYEDWESVPEDERQYLYTHMKGVKKNTREMVAETDFALVSSEINNF